MKKYFTHLMVLVACFLCSMNASAQFSATIESYPIDGWHGEAHNFDLAEVAKALDTDAATLVAALDAWMENEAPTEFLFQTADLAPTSLADYTAENRGFWMTAEGAVVPYDEGKMYSAFSWNAEAGTFTVTLGQTQTAWAIGEEGHCNLVVAYNGKKATFDMTLKVIEEPDTRIDLSTVFVLLDVDQKLDQYQGGTTKQKFNVEGVAATLGITEEELAENLEKYIYTIDMELRGENEESQKPYKTSFLSNKFTANGIGFWFAAVWDDENEAFTNETARCVWGDHAAFRTLYAESFAYDAETHELSFETGFENANLELGTQYKFDIYFVNGIKAVHINNIVTMTEKPYVDPSELVEVGHTDVEVEFEYSSSQYAGPTFSVDLDEILALLECDASDITSYALSDAEGNMSDDYDVANSGFWFTDEGYVGKWASGYFYAGPTEEYGWGEWLVGQYPGKNEDGAEFSTKIFLANGTKYFTINLKVTITKENQGDIVDPSEWESVATWNISASTMPSSDGSYSCDEEPAVDLDALEALIGTRAAKLYGLKQSEDGQTYTKSWNCNPTPGFYVTEDGWVGSWSDGDPWAFSYLPDGAETIRFFQYPGKNELGTVRKGTFFLVNEQNGKMVTLKLTLIFGEATNYEDVGSSDVIIPAADDDIEVDFSAAVEGLGVAAVNDVLGTNMRVMLDDGQWSELIGASDGAAININGGLDLSAGNADAVVYIYPMPGNDDNSLVLELETGNVALEAGQKIQTKISFENETEAGVFKRYILNITILDKEAYDGISEVSSKAVADKAYDLSGRRSDMSQKGVYVVNGKKVVK